jgi:hypothetical protein
MRSFYSLLSGFLVYSILMLVMGLVPVETEEGAPPVTTTEATVGEVPKVHDAAEAQGGLRASCGVGDETCVDERNGCDGTVYTFACGSDICGNENNPQCYICGKPGNEEVEEVP